MIYSDQSGLCPLLRPRISSEGNSSIFFAKVLLLAGKFRYMREVGDFEKHNFPNLRVVCTLKPLASLEAGSKIDI